MDDLRSALDLRFRWEALTALRHRFSVSESSRRCAGYQCGTSWDTSTFCQKNNTILGACQLRSGKFWTARGMTISRPQSSNGAVTDASYFAECFSGAQNKYFFSLFEKDFALM